MVVVNESSFGKLYGKEISPQCTLAAEGAVARPVRVVRVEGEFCKRIDQLVQDCQMLVYRCRARIERLNLRTTAIPATRSYRASSCTKSTAAPSSATRGTTAATASVLWRVAHGS